MSESMIKLFHSRIANGLRKKAVTTPSRWAEANRVMSVPIPGPWRFEHHPWLRGMHDSTAQSNVGQKAAQMGYTETMLNLTFYNIDILKRDCLYILPSSHPDASQFSASRFDPALLLSDYLNDLFSEVQNVGHKRAGVTNLYIRGSHSKSQLKSVPAGFLVMDEVDEMDQDNIKLAEERQSGQFEKQMWKISTPTFPGNGINKFFNTSTQEHFFFKCPSCSKYIELNFPDNLIRTSDDPYHPDLQNSHLICGECKNILPHKDKKVFLQTGKWVPTKEGTDVRGFYINQLYSPTVSPADIARLYLEALHDVTSEQEFFNSKLGQVHIVYDACVTDDQINECIGSHKRHLEGKYQHNNKPITMGIDVGNRIIHYEIDEWTLDKKAPYGDCNTYAQAKLISFGTVREFGELDLLMHQFGVHYAIIDSDPARRDAYAFVMKHYGRAKMCRYTRGVAGRHTVPSQEIDQAVGCDRTSWLDMSLGRFKRGKTGIELPSDIDREYREGIKAQVRNYLRDADGNPVGKYETLENKQDHYGHARNYAEIALQFALGIGPVTTIKDSMV